MKKFIKNYKSSLLLIGSMILGVILGLIFKEKILVIKPLGSIFISLLSLIIVPLVFTSITLSIANMQSNKVFKVLKNIFIVFLIFSIIACIYAVICTYSYRFVSSQNNINIVDNFSTIKNESILEKTAEMIVVDDFVKLFSKENLVALIVFSIIVGIAINKTKEKTKNLIKIIENINTLIMEIINIIMLYAPFGICAFISCQVGTLGISIATDYLKVFIFYTISSLIFAFVFYSIICLISKRNVKTFWKEAIPVILCSISTCSSAACIPFNISACKKIGIKDEVASSTIPLGSSFHKDGSVIDSVFKIMFLVYLLNLNVSHVKVFIIAIISTLLVTAVPVGGGTMCEALILSFLGLNLGYLPILTIIATITDAPATLLNALGDTSAAVLVDRISSDT